MITEQLPLQQNNLDLSICFNEGSAAKPRRCYDHVLFAFIGRRLSNDGDQSFVRRRIVSHFVRMNSACGLFLRRREGLLG